MICKCMSNFLADMLCQQVNQKKKQWNKNLQQRCSKWKLTDFERYRICLIVLFSESYKTMECIQNLTKLKVLDTHTEKWQKLKPVWGTLIVHFQCQDHKQHVCTLYKGEHARTCMHFVSIPMQVCYILLHMLILLVVVFSDQYFFLILLTLWKS